MPHIFAANIEILLLLTEVPDTGPMLAVKRRNGNPISKEKSPTVYPRKSNSKGLLRNSRVLKLD